MDSKAMTNEDIRAVSACFSTVGTYDSFSPISDGHINRTYTLNYQTPAGRKRYVLQAVNTTVFTKPVELIENISRVTDFLRKKIRAEGGDPARETLRLVEAKDGKLYVENEGGFWRLYDFIEGAVAYQTVERPVLFENAARAFGKFQRLLSDYPAATLHETIPHFHDTPKRFRDFHAALEADVAGRRKTAEKEIAFYLAQEPISGTITNEIARGNIPLRVTHNDTKLNNIMMDEKTDQAVCVIDLDTVMPGSALYDFGDSIRFGASSGAEDEQDVDKIFMRLDLFQSYTAGYLEEAKTALTEAEIARLPMSAILMTLECGVRFLTDYLNGDTYFQTGYPTHNLVRCRTQAKLVADMLQKQDQMAQIVSDICKQ